METEVEAWARQGGLLRGIAVLRLVSVGWSTVVLAVDGRSGVAEHPWWGVPVLAAAWVWALVSVTEMPSLRPTVVLDTVVAVCFVVVDALVWPGPHPQSFGSVWPLVAIIGAATFGRANGVAVGAGISVVHIVVAAAAGSANGRWLALLGAAALQVAAGWVAGTLIERVRGSEAQLASQRTRAEIAAAVHDNVLQTLAAVQRRSGDAELVALCAESDRDIRDLLVPKVEGGDASLAGEVRRRVELAARRFGTTVPVTVVGEDRTIGPAVAEALASASAEAAANALEHAHASRIVVCVDLGEADRVTVTVDDDGDGLGETPAGAGIAGSIVGRLAAVGGSASLGERRGGGTVVTMKVMTP